MNESMHADGRTLGKKDDKTGKLTHGGMCSYLVCVGLSINQGSNIKQLRGEREQKQSNAPNELNNHHLRPSVRLSLCSGWRRSRFYLEDLWEKRQDEVIQNVESKMLQEFLALTEVE